MSPRAWAYIWSVLLTGAILSVVALRDISLTLDQGILLTTLVVLATSAQLLKALAPNHQSFYATQVFFFAGVLLLHPFLVVLLIAVPHLVEWAKERRSPGNHLGAWYLQPFNIAMYTIAALSAQCLYRILSVNSPHDLPLWAVVAIALAAVIYVVVNHAVVGEVLVLARGISWRESGVLSIESIETDLILLCLGAVVALLWERNPWTIVLALSPLVLMYRALLVPQLEHEARSDAKTGLWNARHFNTLFAAELGRAQRFHRPLGVIMADLDFMRNINNTYGHLAGDIVLAGIGKVVRGTVREYDIAGRFGGEEFALILLEAGSDDVRNVAERLRAAIEATPFTVATSPVPIHATMSIGVACFPRDGATITELTHAADVAVYQAKAQGRNQVVCFDEVTEDTVLAHTPSRRGQARTAPSH